LKIDLHPKVSENPIRSELFSADRLEQHARSLAEAQRVGRSSNHPTGLPRQLKRNARQLVTDYRALAQTAKAAKPITSAGEWFLDNFYIVEEQAREVVKDLPPSFYRQLPRLLDGPLAGYPRVYGIAWALIAHTDSTLDIERLERFLKAYQEVSSLTIGELWAIAITLRLTLVENLARLTAAVVARVSAAERAENAANLITAALAREEPERNVLNALDDEVITPAFLARFEQRLRDHGVTSDHVLREVEKRFEALGTTSEAVIHGEYQAQSADDISVRNTIAAMRLVSNIDWADFFEDVSLVDKALASAARYTQMDFPTRNRYRRAIEILAQRAPLDEIQVAQSAVREAQAASRMGKPPRESDVGFYLIGDGRREFEKRIGYVPSFSQRVARAVAATGLTGYLSAIALFTFAVVALALAMEVRAGTGDDMLAILAILALVPASDLAIAIVNRVATRRLGPESLPAISLKNGVPASCKTVLVVPVLLGREEDIAEQIERLEVHYLSNADAGLQFILLSDWTDADTESTPGDQILLDAAREKIAELNRRYPNGPKPLFLLLHRRRQWNPAQNVWMGWERKRGKLHELNRLLRGDRNTSFLDIDGSIVNLQSDVRYVITLDADTRLPRGAALKLIGKMAHPLNAPQIDQVSGTVTAGHGILQPRVTPSLPIGTEGSLFQWAFSGPNGLDPYAFAVSDVYQDLFDQGSFVGKGIYDVEAFERSLDQRIPENTILSHDLLEGTFARAALASDIEVVEEFPSRYDVEVARQHRWVRGDWQLLPWIFGFGAARQSTIVKPGLPALGRWKMIDNLRRSLSAPALLLALLVGWVLPPAAAAWWTAFLIVVFALPPLLPILGGLLPSRRGYSRRGHLRNVARDALLAFTQLVFTVSFLARIAYLSLDAITRTLFRLFVSRRRLLEWVTFAQLAYSRRNGSNRALAFQLLGSFVFAGVAIAAIVYCAPHNLIGGAPFLALWAFSPLIARWASQAPLIEPHLNIAPSDRDALRLAARRTWLFFERFITAEDNMLPPDNFQEAPKPFVAHRTSPTNIGLYLCSILAARDFGWIGTLETVERLETTLTSLQKLARYRGHFLNWYDTTTLGTLEPRYVSTVDSGNLAGNLLVVKNACAEITEKPVVAVQIDGFVDAMALLRESLSSPQRIAEPLRREVMDVLSDMEVHCSQQADNTFSLDSIRAIETAAETLASDIAQIGDTYPALREAVNALARWARSHRRDADELAEGRSSNLVQRLARIADNCRTLSEQMEFGFLFDEDRQLLSIGYRVDEQQLDSNAYDLLASEARLASFFAIAKGDIPTRHWFRLGRTLTPLGRSSALQSWSGSMFEYLMPSLIMHEPSGSLLALSNRSAVRRQIDYATDLGLPWGISESQYNARDRDQNYQYSGFGVPDLGIKRGLGENTVIAPYASGLAAMIVPTAARKNLDRLTHIGALGTYGWYEAIDYTRARLPENVSSVVIQAYMAHHQGMMILGIADVLCDGTMRERFHAEPMVKAAELLLQERMPRDVSVARLPPEMATGAITIYDNAPRAPRTFVTPHTSVPRTHLLSNGDYSVMMTAAGSGYSRWNGLAITRWQEDTTRDHWGSFIYLRDLANGKVWSAGHQPICADADSYEATFSEDRATITRTDGALVTSMETLVSPEDNAEVRRLSITNRGTRLREIEVTSYMELALARPADDDAHPAFSKLFVQSEYVHETGALLATRRTRSPSDPTIWAAHLSIVDGKSVGDVQYETDRARFLSRNRTARSPAAVMGGWPLSNSAGAVLDPIFALRRRVQIPRGQTVTISFWTMVAPTREDIVNLIDRHQETTAFDRASTLAATHAQSQIQYLGLVGEESHLFQLLANYVIYADAALRAPREILEQTSPPPSALWPLGISGDLPIVLVRLSEEEHLPFVRQLIRAHDYWRIRRLPVDLVILNERVASYAQDLQKALEKIVHTMDRSQDQGGPLGRIYLVRADIVGREACGALRAAARVDLSSRRGTLAEQLKGLTAGDSDAQPAAVVRPGLRIATALETPALRLPPLTNYNGFGGFTTDGREYVIQTKAGQPTPAPWINVIANEKFGFQVSAEGSGFCWAMNSQQNKVTPWSNDPVSDESGDAIYLKDLSTDEVWSATASPIADPLMQYVTRHGQGYSRFETTGRGIAIDMTQFVPLSDTVKISRLRIANMSDEQRKLSITQYADWAFGQLRGSALPYLVTEIDPETNALYARNPWNAEFRGQVGFLDMSGRQSRWTGDRREFLGRNGAKDNPAALLRKEPLSGRVGTGLDSCGVLQADINLSVGEELEIVLVLGWAPSKDDARALVAKYRAANCSAALSEVKKYWDDALSSVQIKTPDPAMDLLVNRWLLYQTLACRIWGRAGFYQASGAYGFRDQLQDGMALCRSRPALVREHLLRAAGRQFAEGDVQHWWLPESGKGIRSRISDDKAWLGYVAAHYLGTTGDTSLLDEPLAFIAGPQLHDGEHDAFFQPEPSSKTASFYEHCARALDASLAVGQHGLPLMGTGDWNDGMNRVGENGKGESVWLGWFLHEALARFLHYAEERHDAPRVASWLVHMTALREALEIHGWDGDWYRRAFFDDGFALGSAVNRECRIDSIAQAWSVISNAAPAERAARAMEAVEKYLVRAEDRLMPLFTPPFVSSTHDPGYIKGYPAGIRENGGQYTHGVLWSIIAFAMMGNGDRAAELFSMLNPINHARTRSEAERYRVEPYVACGDVYSVPPNVGRGGWTWYSGSAAWMYRTSVEYIMGIRFAGNRLFISPSIPKRWPQYEATVRQGATTYGIFVDNSAQRSTGVARITLDGEVVDFSAGIPLRDDRQSHQIRVVMGEPSKADRNAH
jgi:cyclic beta-1,2-glucan synthetase